MAFTSDEFKSKMEEIEHTYHEWFSKHPPIGNSNVNSIHDHYYIYMSTQGHQLRFNASSDLPVEIRTLIKDTFSEVSPQS
ncbi:hypothetical protein [Arcticibacter tournemirensis]